MTVRQFATTWGMRLLLTASFFVGSELLLWTNLQAFTIADWVVRLVGYLALATLILDLAVRYRIRDIYDVMALIAIYGLLVGLLVAPEVALANFPLTLMTRAIGGHAALGTLVFGLFLALCNGQRPRHRWYLLAFAAWLGFYWGIWIRWQPELNNLFAVVPLPTAFATLGLAFLIVYLLYIVVARSAHNITAQDLQLPPVGFLLLVLVLLLLFIYQAAQERLSVGMIVATSALITLCSAVLWFRRDPTETTLLDQYVPVRSISPRWLGLAAILFFSTTIVSYHLPFFSIGRFNQLFIMEIYFAAGGGIWLPLIAVVIAARGIDTQLRTGVLS